MDDFDGFWVAVIASFSFLLAALAVLGWQAYQYARTAEWPEVVLLPYVEKAWPDVAINWPGLAAIFSDFPVWAAFTMIFLIGVWLTNAFEN